ncbi:MAG: hypothetical protein IT291_02755 [Deltaproteobacteria bacterium]|nr:hypothetical protein [Deltaproteobacteria bacterium]
MELTKEVEEKGFFEQFGLELKCCEVEVGQTYPIFGMITKVFDDNHDDVSVEINHYIIAKIKLIDAEKLEILKQRAFETGIFVATVLAKEPQVQLECRTIIFGRPQAYNA